ncbi:hypothetical protein [Mycobacteroides abscessus]|uniref:hypothetical protein n=1 Tax=Mycobacteroides abscessus TaxID=36809 RepID=UPI0009C48984|nr:hypothetical protein [Mycobacteroides abscessus]SKO14418.1 Uncharacterised protein [Mycobacteroides abscessus subsp. bolletii]SKX37776.1 Uncharacterised protein [Mycobacteroides abscessus subsp. bolletii]
MSAEEEGNRSVDAKSAGGDTGVVFVDELSSADIAAAEADLLPKSGGQVVVIDGYRNPLQPTGNQVFAGEPTGLRRLTMLDQVAVLPDGTVVIWNQDDERQAGVLETHDDGERVVRPISIGFYEDDWKLRMVRPPVWAVTFDDPPQVR